MQIDNVKIFAQQFFFLIPRQLGHKNPPLNMLKKNPAGKPKNSLASLAILFLTWPNQFN